MLEKETYSNYIRIGNQKLTSDDEPDAEDEREDGADADISHERSPDEAGEAQRNSGRVQIPQQQQVQQHEKNEEEEGEDCVYHLDKSI